MQLVRRLLPFAALFFVVATTVRLILAARAGAELWDNPSDVAVALATGAWLDLVTFGWFALPVVAWWLALPRRFHGGRLDRAFTTIGVFAFIGLLGFTAIGEQLFWTEFGTRYNFIAVDYLVYTQEVIGNIRESYPVAPLLGGLGVVCAGLTWSLRRWTRPASGAAGFRERAAQAFAAVVFVVGAYLLSSIDQAERGRNAIADEIGKNGVYALFNAFWTNEIDYRRFYRTTSDDAVGPRVRRLLAGADARFETADDAGGITRIVVPTGSAPARRNVIFVVMESMGAEYMAHFGSDKGLTPNLDRLADEGILFTKAYATGTRTVRGLEALTLSVPPTPGQSIIRRPGNGNLFNIGSVFAERGYDTRFIYGGFGYFDNMNAFYRGNGFQVVDRSDLGREEIRFANVWGVSDEDLFARALKESDRSTAAGRPFFSIVMTTSNHRPFTFPEGAIDLPQGSRWSAVKYADHAIGRLVAEARGRSWFPNTLFVFVADHTAGSAGKVDLALEKYHIPAIVWAPGLVQPARRDRMFSQIDVGPTVLGLIGEPYRSRFFGRDALAAPDADSPVFVSTYQKVGLVRGRDAAILEPKRRVKALLDGRPAAEEQLDPTLVDDAIAYYQFAADWKLHSARTSSLPGKPMAAVR